MSKKINYFIKISMLAGLIILLAFTPLGLIPIGPIYATIIHIPVIIGAVILGPVAGAVLGLVFGACTILRALQLADPLQIEIFVSNPQIALVPRILLGLVAAYSHVLISKITKKTIISYPVSAVLGTVTNTALVVLGIYLFIPKYFELILGAAGVNSPAEIVLAAIIVPPVCFALNKMK